MNKQSIYSRLRTNRISLLLAGLTVCALIMQSCGSSTTTQEQAPEQQTQTIPQGQEEQGNVDDAQVIEAQSKHWKKVEVTITAPVRKLLPDDTRGLPHQKFLLNLSNGTTVLIAHDTKMAPHVPIEPGSIVTIHGEYIWNRKGGLIHWTHHTDTPRHEGGWIDFNGSRYE